MKIQPMDDSKLSKCDRKDEDDVLEDVEIQTETMSVSVDGNVGKYDVHEESRSLSFYKTTKGRIVFAVSGAILMILFMLLGYYCFFVRRETPLPTFVDSEKAVSSVTDDEKTRTESPSSVGTTASDHHLDEKRILLPIKIPVDRAFDVQWNPPGYPMLETYSLYAPWGAKVKMILEGHDCYFAFELSSENDIASFVQIDQTTGKNYTIFDSVEFVAISDDVLMFNGNPLTANFVPGGGYGTILKGMNIPSGPADGRYETNPIRTDDEKSKTVPKEWLHRNFGISPFV